MTFKMREGFFLNKKVELPQVFTEYIRRDPAVLAALPEVQALIAGVLGQAASMMEDNVRHAAELGREIWPIPDLRTLTPADAIAARDAMIAEAVAKEREACARLVDCGCDKRQKAAVIEAKTSAERARACGQYNCGAEDADAIRKRGEG